MALYHQFDSLTNTRGDSLVGYRVIARLPNGGAVQPIFGDISGTPIVTTSGIANTALTDEAGNYSFFISAPGTYDFEYYTPDGTFLNATRFIPLYVGIQGAAGTADNTYGTLSDFKASDIARQTASLVAAMGVADGRFNWTPGDFTGQADDLNIVKANSTALTVGAWVRQKADGIVVRATPTAPVRTVEAKLRERVAITDYGAVSGGDIGAAVDAALAALGTASPAELVVPSGAWSLGAAKDWSNWRNVTFRFEPGALVNQGANTVVLPERTSAGLGARFTGTGAVTTKNKDQALLTTPGAGHFVAGNDALGIGAAGKLTGGYSNLVWGKDALASATYTRSTIAIGNAALKSVVGVSPGTAAYGTYYALGDSNIAIGDIALRDTTTGYENLAVGVGTLVQNTTGRWNVAIGHESQITGTTGEANTSVGCYTLTTTQTSNSTAIGWAAMEVNTSGSGTAVGYVAMNAQTTGTLNVAVGQSALQLNTTGSANTALGQESLKNMVGGGNNTGVGAFALGQTTSAVTNNTAVGRDALLTLTTGNGNTALGSGAGNALTTFSNTIAIGVGVNPTKSDQAVIGSMSIGETLLFGVLRLRSTYTVAGLPSASAMGAGTRSFVTDATVTTFASVVAGGGANGVPVFSDGTAWRIG